METGALVCAWTDVEAEKLEGIAEKGRQNGIRELNLLSAAQARAMVPGLSTELRAAVEVAGEHIIDPWTAPLAYVTQAMALGAEVMRSCELVSGAFDGEWLLNVEGRGASRCRDQRRRPLR